MDTLNLKTQNSEKEQLVNPLVTADATGVMVVMFIIIALCFALSYGADYLSRISPEPKEIGAPSNSPFGTFDSSVPGDLETSLPDLRTAFFATPEPHNHLTGSVIHYRFLNVSGETYVLLLFAPTAYPNSTSAAQKAAKREDSYLVLFSKYSDVYPDILILSEDPEISSLPLTLETDGTYFIFPNYGSDDENNP